MEINLRSSAFSITSGRKKQLTAGANNPDELAREIGLNCILDCSGKTNDEHPEH
jgi:hypothetical protein